MTKIAYPYAVTADIHFHNWNFGSYTNTEGVNSRLQDTIDEFKRMASVLKEQGGRDIVIAGDMFHTRGEIKPSVFNPVHSMFKELSSEGFRIHAIPGNHDLETEETEVNGNCFAAFSSIKEFHIYHNATVISFDGEKGFEGWSEAAVFLPWSETFYQYAKTPVLDTYRQNLTIFAHVGLTDVIPGLHGTVEPNWFPAACKKVKNVFCGHFHNHKEFPVKRQDGDDASIFSIGALTHQSFKDVGSKAGFVIATSKNIIKHYDSEAPEFVDYDETDWLNPLALDRYKFQGNFVRISKEMKLTNEEGAAIKISLEGTGALRVIDRSGVPKGPHEPVGCPTSYTYGSTSVAASKISDEMKKYIESKYDRIMAASIIAYIDEEDLDE